VQNVLKPVPDSSKIPNSILDAKRNGKLTIFVGAGYPKPFGCWGWDELAEGFIKRCGEAKILNARQRKHYSDLIKERGARSVISVCYNALINADRKDDIDSLLKESCEVEQSEIDSLKEVYSKLRQLGDYFITTNYDQHFDVFFRKEDIVYKASEFYKPIKEEYELSREKIYHIHGSLIESESIVLTATHYVERYNNLNYRAFLESIFRKYNVLFIGYGLRETDLSNILLKLKSEGCCNSHFILKHYFSTEIDTHSFDLSEYNDLNVQIIPYIGDEKYFRALYDIVESWVNSINEMELVVV